MSKFTITSKTKEQILAAFDAVFRNIVPHPTGQTVSVADRLEPYREAVMQQRDRGLNWKQISDGMADVRIGEKVSVGTLKRVFGGDQKKRRKAKSTPRKKTPKRALSKGDKPHLILDRTTGLPVDQAPVQAPLPPPAPAAPKVKASGLPPRWRPVFDRVAPRILRNHSVGDVAIGYLVEAVGKDLHAETDEMNAFVEAAMAEFDAMDCDTAMIKYQMKAEDWDDWRPRWCELRDLGDDVAKR